jgi:hypothetical protein
MPAVKWNKSNWTAPDRLCDLAEFRYQLRKFLSFSENVSESRGIPAQQYQLLQVVAMVPEGQESSISYIAERMMVRHNSAAELVAKHLSEIEANGPEIKRSLEKLLDSRPGTNRKSRDR